MIKKLTFLAFFSILFLSVSGQEVFTVGSLEMTFDQTSIELGKVKKGEIKNFEYRFTNTGKEAIKIDIVSGCDCTTTDWPRKPILPGQKGTIQVTFDSTEKEQSETVDVDIYLRNEDPKTGNPILKIVNYSFDLIL